MNPKISIIVPVYNIDQHLRKCLDSILVQTFLNFEVIVVNDGSTDQSGEICDEYEKKDERIQVIHQDHQGISVARNMGVTQATGDYIGFVDGDDYIAEEMYQKLYQVCVETESSIAICKMGREIDGELTNGNIGDNYTEKLNNEKAMRELFKGVLYRFSLCNKLFKKECFENVYFPIERIHEDLSTTYKLFANANQAVYVNYIGYIYVKQKNSILTTTYHEKRLDAFAGWNEIIPFMQQKYSQLSNEVMECFVYSVMDHFYYILNQVKDKNDQRSYLDVVQFNIRNHYKDIWKCSTLSFTHKFITAAINYNVYLFVILNRLRRVKK